MKRKYDELHGVPTSGIIRFGSQPLSVIPIIHTTNYTIPACTSRIELRNWGFLVSIQAPALLGVYTVLLDGQPIGQSDVYGRFLFSTASVPRGDTREDLGPLVDYLKISGKLEIEFNAAQFHRMVAMSKGRSDYHPVFDDHIDFCDARKVAPFIKITIQRRNAIIGYIPEDINQIGPTDCGLRFSP